MFCNNIADGQIHSITRAHLKAEYNSQTLTNMARLNFVSMLILESVCHCLDCPKEIFYENCYQAQNSSYALENEVIISDKTSLYFPLFISGSLAF